MSNTGLFPNMVLQMIAIGEESGSLDDMLGKVADFYEAEVDDAVAGLSSLLEPIIIVFLGVLIGGSWSSHVPAHLQARRGRLMLAVARSSRRDVAARLRSACCAVHCRCRRPAAWAVSSTS